MFNPFKQLRGGLMLRRLVRSNEDIAASLRAIVRHLEVHDDHIGIALDTDWTDVEVLHTTDRDTWAAEQKAGGDADAWWREKDT